MGKIANIIFDFDGVLADSFKFHFDKIREFTKSKFTEEEFRDIHNGNFFDKVPLALKNVKWEDYRDFIYDEQILIDIRDEIREAVLELSKNYKLHIISSGGYKNIKGFLGNNGVLECFGEILGLEACKTKVAKFNMLFDKYSIKSEECIFVTDTLGDILEAKNVGVKTIAVEWGFHNNDTLKIGNPLRIISHIDELFEIINN